MFYMKKRFQFLSQKVPEYQQKSHKILAKKLQNISRKIPHP